MNIALLFFGAAADASGARETEIKMAEGSTVGEVLEELTQTKPGLRKHKLLVALNEEYVSIDSLVRDGDTLAIFTPVSGG